MVSAQIRHHRNMAGDELPARVLEPDSDEDRLQTGMIVVYLLAACARRDGLPVDPPVLRRETPLNHLAQVRVDVAHHPLNRHVALVANLQLDAILHRSLLLREQRLCGGYSNTERQGNREKCALDASHD